MSEPLLFERRLTRHWRARAARSGQEHFLAGRAAGDLAERIGEISRTFARMLEICAVPGALAGLLIAQGKASEAMIGLEWPSPGQCDLPSAVVDEDALSFAPGSFDLVAIVLTLHGVNDLPGALAQINAMLEPDGLFIANLFGGATLTELRQSFAAAEDELYGGAAPRVMPFTDLRDAGALLQRAGMTLAVADSDHFTVRYDHPLALMRDVRAMGEANALRQRSRRPMTRRLMQRMSEIYADRFMDGDGKIRASFEIVTLTGWCAHESQQQPLAPGSARIKLADALGTSEHSAGETARPGGARPEGPKKNCRS